MYVMLLSLATLVLTFSGTSAEASNNTRSFYLQLSGFGPTSGSPGDATTKWIQSTPWSSSYLSVSAGWDTTASQLSQVRSLNWSVTATVHGSPRWNVRSASAHPWENLTYAMRQYELAGFKQEEIILEYITEDDSAGVGFPQDLLALARASGYSNGATNLSPSQAQEAWEKYLQEAFKTTSPYPNIQRHSRVGFPQNTHSVAPTTDVVMVEVANDDVGTLPPALVFLRGAATQYGIKWGVDLSLWWGVINGCVEDLPSSLHTRTMTHSYVAGAQVVSVEGCGWMKPTQPPTPNDMAQAVDQFGRFLLRLEPHTRETSADTLMVVIIDEQLGWSERPSWYTGTRTTSWSYANIPSNQNPLASSFDALMQILFPGVGNFGFLAFPFGAFKRPLDPPGAFSRTYVTEPYVPSKEDIFEASPNLPFGSFDTRNTLHDWFEKGTVDPAPYRPMADSRYGNVVDVHVDDDQQRAWDTYDIVWWSSHEKLNGSTVQALQDYANKGGVVVIPTGVMSDTVDAITSLTGVSVGGEVRAVRAWTISNGKDGEEGEADVVREGHFLVAAVNQMDTDVSVVSSSIPGGNPIVVRKPVGNGWIYTCLSPFYGPGMDKPVRALLDMLLSERQHVVVESGPPTLFWTTSRWDKGKARVVSVSNNADVAWQGRLSMKLDDISGCGARTVGGLSSVVQCVDMWGDTSVSCEWSSSSSVLFTNLTIEAHGIKVVKVSCS